MWELRLAPNQSLHVTSIMLYMYMQDVTLQMDFGVWNMFSYHLTTMLTCRYINLINTGLQLTYLASTKRTLNCWHCLAWEVGGSNT